MVAWKVQEWRERTKKRLIDGFGGSCNKCGYNRCRSALDIHHKDPTTKSFTISDALKNPKAWNDLVDEAAKCILLCKICHCELHAGLWAIEDISIVAFSGEKEQNKAETPTGRCPVCNNDVFMNNICCSKECAAKRSCKINWPDTLVLNQWVQETSQCDVARRLGVSEAAVRKRLNKFLHSSIGRALAC